MKVICGNSFGPRTRGQTGTVIGRVLDWLVIQWDGGLDNDIAGYTLCIHPAWFAPGWIEENNNATKHK